MKPYEKHDGSVHAIWQFVAMLLVWVLGGPTWLALVFALMAGGNFGWYIARNETITKGERKFRERRQD